ncbi:protein yellow-like [Arctopsyche grandis]|uniref:protein yellow-like n=1 Tax=Arctopsyche grandis TaxID=121162 RepID=UPI00406D8D0E
MKPAVFLIFSIQIYLIAGVDLNSNNNQTVNQHRYLSRKREQFRVIYEWNTLNFTWPSNEAYQTAVNTSQYVPKNVLVSGLKIFGDKMYVTVPRIKEGVPATLAWIPATPSENDTSPRLNPFPSWEMNTIGDCRGFQSVQSFEIDLSGYMWVIDNGRTSTMKPNSSLPSCLPTLTLVDLNQGLNKMTRYNFPDNVAGSNSYLNDIVIDDSEGGFAYITDNSGADPGIIVFNRKENRSWKFRDSRSMVADPDASHFSLNGTERTMSINVDGIALGPRFINSAGDVDRLLYFSPLSSFKLYVTPTSVLKNESLSTQPASLRVDDVKIVGAKTSQTDGMIMDEEGILYFGLIGDYAIAQWDSRTNFSQNQEIIAKDKNFIQWVDRFAFDVSNNLYVVINRLHNFVLDKVNVDEVNYRILRTNVGAKSYLYSPMLLPAVKVNPQPQPNQGQQTVTLYKSKSANSSPQTTISTWMILMCLTYILFN